jgi:hypothetical protein
LSRLHLTFPYLNLQALQTLQLPGDQTVDPETDGTAEAAAAGVPVPEIHPSLAPDPVLDFLAALGRFEAELAARSWQWLDAETFTLSSQAARLARTREYRVLLHGRWLQPVPPRNAPQPLLVQTGPRYGDAFALEGFFAVTLGRYLHFRADLAYREPLMGRNPLTRALAPTGLATSEPPDLELTPAGYMHLSESRRMRSEELHYLDHPKLGVLVRIEPVQIPPELSAAFTALEESRQ